MVGIWLEYGWNMVGIWLEYGWNMVGIWLEYGWNGWNMVGIWLEIWLEYSSFCSIMLYSLSRNTVECGVPYHIRVGFLYPLMRVRR